jgi:hypothetical protein
MDEADVKRMPTLEELARERFTDLSEAELRLLRAAPEGTLAHCGDPALGNKDPVNNPRHADTWGNERDIRNELIRWLCIDPDAQNRIDPLGIRVQSARISGELNLSFIIIRFPLFFRFCKFDAPLSLILADLPELDFSGSAVDALSADGVHVKGSFHLRAGFSAEGEINLYGASVGGTLDCSRGSFKNAKGDALYAENAKIAGDFFFREGFSEGEVRLAGASIGGNLECDKGSFKNQDGDALNAITRRSAGMSSYGETSPPKAR